MFCLFWSYLSSFCILCLSLWSAYSWWLLRLSLVLFYALSFTLLQVIRILTMLMIRMIYLLLIPEVVILLVVSTSVLHWCIDAWKLQFLNNLPQTWVTSGVVDLSRGWPQAFVTSGACDLRRRWPQTWVTSGVGDLRRFCLDGFRPFCLLASKSF